VKAVDILKETLEHSGLHEEWCRAKEGQLNGEEPKKWRIIGSVMKENRKVTLTLGDGWPHRDFWNVRVLGG
jgi:hypothetical protein